MGRRVAPPFGLVALMTLIGLVSAACAGTVVTSVPIASMAAASSAAADSPTSGAATPTPVAPTGSAAAPTSPTLAASPTSPSAPGANVVALDPSLLALLPASVGGLPVAAVDRPAGLDDPALANSVERFAQAFVIDPVSNDFATSSVIALRPGVYNDAYFRTWRDSFDEGACSQSGGVADHTQTTIAGRTVYIGTCTGGAITYHVHLAADDAIVSISAFGEHHLGEQILAGLRP